ncbi:MAG: hypothetical protein QOE61_303 [Micromonosporaceae bacterium]|nr:hypothetical protein [Micromonosporaceae bacterium]
MLVRQMSELQVRWHGQTLVIGDGDADLSTDLLQSLPVEPDRCTVLVLDAATADVQALEQILDTWLPPAIRSVRLALSRAGASGLAQQLADRMDIEVIAPDGPVVLLPAGVLFVTSPAFAKDSASAPKDGTPDRIQGGLGGWWTHRPGQHPDRQGPHHPAPPWLVELPKRQRLRPSALVAHAIPCGVWLHTRGRRPVSPDDPAFAIPADPHRITVLIGRPGSRSVPIKALYAWLAALPYATLEALTLMPYGQAGTNLDAVAEKLSEAFLVTVQRTAGVPAFGADGTSLYALVDDDGQPLARRIVQRLSYQSEFLHDVNAWLNPLTGSVGTDQTRIPVGPGWVLEVVRSGLWLHDGAAPDDREIAGRPADADTETFVVDVGGDPDGEALARWIAAGLPGDIAVNLRWEVRTAAAGDGSDRIMTTAKDET